VLQCVAVCCSVLQCVAVCCSVLQCVAVCGSIGVVSRFCGPLQQYRTSPFFCECAAVCCSVLQRVAVSCSVLQCVAMCCSVLQCVIYIHISRSYVTHMNESCYTYEWALMLHVCVSRGVHMNDFRMCNMAHSYATHSCIHILRGYVLINSHSYVWYDSFICNMTHLYGVCIWMSHVAHANESCYSYKWVVSNVWVWHLRMSHVTNIKELCHTCE